MLIVKSNIIFKIRTIFHFLLSPLLLFNFLSRRHVRIDLLETCCDIKNVFVLIDVNFFFEYIHGNIGSSVSLSLFPLSIYNIFSHGIFLFKSLDLNVTDDVFVSKLGLPTIPIPKRS